MLLSVGPLGVAQLTSNHTHIVKITNTLTGNELFFEVASNGRNRVNRRHFVNLIDKDDRNVYMGFIHGLKKTYHRAEKNIKKGDPVDVVFSSLWERLTDSKPRELPKTWEAEVKTVGPAKKCGRIKHRR